MHCDSIGSWRCARRAGLCHVVAPGGVRIAASASVPGSGIAGADAFGIADADWPSGAQRQRMRFGFRSEGFFAAEPGAHLVIGLAARWRKDNPTTAQFDGCLMGRGIIIGNVSGAPNGWAQSPVIQIESFRSDGNALFAQTGSPCLQDGVGYEVVLWTDRIGAIGYQLFSASKEPIVERQVNDGGANLPAGLGGWWITHVFSDANPAAEWAIDFVDLSVSWE